MLRLMRAAEIARGKTLNGTSPIRRARPDVAPEVAPAEREVDLRQRARRLADERLHPLAPELVAVAVEEDVARFSTGCGAKKSGSAPQKTASARRAPSSSSRSSPPSEFETTRSYSARVGAVVVVEAGVHAAELGQAHRHVAVVEDDRHAEALAQRAGMPRRCAIGTVKTRTASGRSRSTRRLEVPLPARRHPAPDRLARQPVGERVVRAVLGAAQVAVALQPRGERPRRARTTRPRR